MLAARAYRKQVAIFPGQPRPGTTHGDWRTADLSMPDLAAGS